MDKNANGFHALACNLWMDKENAGVTSPLFLPVTVEPEKINITCNY